MYHHINLELLTSTVGLKSRPSKIVFNKIVNILNVNLSIFYCKTTIIDACFRFVFI